MMNSRKSIIITGALLIAAVALAAAAFGGSRNCCKANMSSNNEGARTAEAVEQDGAQTATVEVTDKGFEPSSLKLKAGAPAKVTFVRKTDGTCAKEVVIKEYKIERKLPLNEPVTVEFTPRKGEFAFACGMDMVRGKLIVE
ncbi:MAG TPA: cupredoxin domain-containing protein [Blastocatellia bacterium]|nr:cupredoxin domain-containing protein [Blastocatellia bacterium]